MVGLLVMGFRMDSTAFEGGGGGGGQRVRFASQQLAPTAPATMAFIAPIQCQFHGYVDLCPKVQWLG